MRSGIRRNGRILVTLAMSILEADTHTGYLKILFEKKRNSLPALRTEPLKNRRQRLSSLHHWIHANRPAIHKAMFDDFRKPSAEVDAIEIFHVLNEIRLAIDNLEDWARPKKVDAPLTMLGTRSFIQYEPRGVCLIISPWNYPFSLAVGPLVSALAAGNSVVLKPSEHTPHVSALLKRMCEEVFSDDIVSVVEGDAEISKSLLKLPFDHIFFTGSPAIGKVVMKAAAENLSSVTLELGGKSPTIVTDSANLNDACERIAVSKFVNNGQTCVAPDYVLVDETVLERFVSLLISKLKLMFSENGNFESAPSYCRIVNEKQFICYDTFDVPEIPDYFEHNIELSSSAAEVIREIIPHRTDKNIFHISTALNGNRFSEFTTACQELISQNIIKHICSNQRLASFEILDIKSNDGKADELRQNCEEPK